MRGSRRLPQPGRLHRLCRPQLSLRSAFRLRLELSPRLRMSPLFGYSYDAAPPHFVVLFIRFSFFEDG